MAVSDRFSISQLSAMTVIGAAFLVLYLMASPRSFAEGQTFTSPKANVDYLLTQRFAHGHGFRYPLKHYQELPTDIARALTPRDAAELHGSVVPKDFAGNVLFYGMLFAIWKPLVLVASPLFGVLSAFVLAKIGGELFDRWVGFGAFLLWLAHPVLFMNASIIIVESDMIALFGMLCGFLYFCRYWRGRQNRDLVAMSLAFGFAVLMRYPNALVLIPLGLGLLFTGRIRWREATLAVVCLVPFGATILVFNRFTYGAFATTGYGLGAQLWLATMNRSGHTQVHLAVAGDYIKHYLLKWPLVLGPPVLGLASAIYVAWRVVRLRRLILILLLGTLGLTIYYLPIDAYGRTRAVLNASVLRYLMPVLGLWMVFFMRGLYQLVGRRIVIATAVVAAMMIGSLWVSWSMPGGARDTRRTLSYLALFRQHVLATTEPDSIVASAVMDKVLFPERQTLTLAYLQRQSRPIQENSEDVWFSFPSPDRFAEVAMQIHQRGIPLYVLLPASPDLAHLYKPALREVGLRLRQLRKVSPNFYEVVPLRRKG